MYIDNKIMDFVESNLHVIKDAEETLKDYFSEDAFERMSQAIDNIKDAYMINWYDTEIHKQLSHMKTTVSTEGIDWNSDIIEDCDLDDKMKEFMVMFRDYKNMKKAYAKNKADTLTKYKMIETARDLAKKQDSILKDIYNSAVIEEEMEIWKKYKNL